MRNVVLQNRRLLLLAVAGASIAGVVSALLGWFEAALALFGVAGLAGFVWIVVWAHTVNVVLTRLRRRIDALGAKTTSSTLSSQLVDVKSQLAGISARVDRADAAVRRTYTMLQKIPSDTVEVGRLYDSVVHHDRPMPELGNWAMTPRSLVWIVDRIRTTSLETIVECGSGSSTIWFATAMEHRGGPGRIIALEADGDYAEYTRSRLAELGLSHRAQVIHAPLVDTALTERPSQPWFDLAAFPDDVTSIDLLFVDAPISTVAQEVRYPGFPLLADRLPPGATVVLDDTNRPDERRITEAWLDERPAGRRLTVVATVDRSTVFSVEVD